MRFCSECGGLLPAQDGWPYRCPGCSRQFFRNPTPVAVTLIPVGDGVLAVRRAIPPGQGELALPGGFVNWGESWQEAACREVWEETGLRLEPGEIEMLDLVSVAEGHLLIFCTGRPRRLEECGLDHRDAEIEELVVVREPIQLAFPTHTEALRKFFSAASAAS